MRAHTAKPDKPRKLFVNLPVSDLRRSVDFFGALGFGFDPRFCDDNAACMVLSGEAYVMLLRQSFFKTFTRRTLCDPDTQTEALLALSCAYRTEVDALVQRALQAGGSPAMAPVDHGFMYSHSFYDLDGHHWEVLWMDDQALQPSGLRDAN